MPGSHAEDVPCDDIYGIWAASSSPPATQWKPYSLWWHRQNLGSPRPHQTATASQFAPPNCTCPASHYFFLVDCLSLSLFARSKSVPTSGYQDTRMRYSLLKSVTRNCIRPLSLETRKVWCFGTKASAVFHDFTVIWYLKFPSNSQNVSISVVGIPVLMTASSKSGLLESVLLDGKVINIILSATLS